MMRMIRQVPCVEILSGRGRGFSFQFCDVGVKDGIGVAAAGAADNGWYRMVSSVSLRFVCKLLRCLSFGIVGKPDHKKIAVETDWREAKAHGSLICFQLGFDFTGVICSSK